MGGSVTGFEQVKLMLMQGGERATQAARRQMKKEAKKIKDLSVLNCPVDKHNLEKAHHLVEERVGVGGRKRFYVVVGGTVDGVNVDQYAMRVHEEHGPRPDGFGVGPGTIAKAKALNRFVGRKFLERAYDERAPHITNELIQAVSNAIESRGVGAFEGADGDWSEE
ncbi:hypothetical protein [Magnetospirillum molischianum]|uniref:Phage protein, HK97 gp10 family n=1 Tax=Magnetospirillum molischianum DSM 120 TaxID=1150626 RepID=H8FY53_MAGML|nr:hypothetical protein [Magnetospirillum molischianum]CCG43291.1 hypothetical protein PHAMO_80082 [Magnetospirillum molischianum DSM 120]